MLKLTELTDFIMSEHKINLKSNMFYTKFNKIYQNFLKDLQIYNLSNEISSYGNTKMIINYGDYSKFYNKHTCSTDCYLYFLKNENRNENINDNYLLQTKLMNSLLNDEIFIIFIEKLFGIYKFDSCSISFILKEFVNNKATCCVVIIEILTYLGLFNFIKLLELPFNNIKF